MGLLSDPEYGSLKWVKILKKVHGPVSGLCYIGALVWFVMLGLQTFNNETYFSENALLPGLVTNEFFGENSAKQFHNEFIQELQDKYYDTDAIPVPWLVGKMSQLNLEVYTHNFTLNYPLGPGQVFKGTNVYGILRAPRTSSLEAIVVTAPYRTLTSHQKGTTAGIALMLAFANFARSQKYWAKDIIFLVTEHEQLGMQAWLEAYHGIDSNSETLYTSLGSFWKQNEAAFNISKLTFGLLNDFQSSHKKCLDPGKLKGLSGSIQAAINLEFHTPKIKYIEVKVEGLNGQLPNLDLVNLVHKLCVKSGIHHSYNNRYSWIRSRDQVDDWKKSVWTMLSMVTTHLSGVPNGNHGLFHRFGIEAVTLEGRDAKDPSGSPPKVNSLSTANFYRLGIALESILRSLNNLLERFHQSYFFYLLAGSNRFISIGQYMPSLCLLCVAILLKALTIWVTIQSDDDNSNQQKEVTEEEEDKEVKKHKKKSKAEKKNAEDKSSIVGIGANYLLVHLLGYIVMCAPFSITVYGAKYHDLPAEQSVFYGLIIISVIIAIISPYLISLLHQGRISREEMYLVNVLLLIELATVCMAVGMHNFSLGLCLATVYTPVALVANVVVEDNRSFSKFVLLLKRIFCLLLHPLSVVVIGMTVYSKIVFPEDNFLSMMSRGKDAAMQAIMFSVVDSMIYGNWLFNIAASLVLPIWILFWQIVCNKVKKY